MKDSVILDNVTKTFMHEGITVNALDGVSLSVKHGEFIAIMGKSGSGKTTLLNILGCLDVVSSGRYMLRDRDVSSMNDDELSEVRNSMIGFVFQQFYLLPYATVTENVLLPTLYRKKGELGHLKKRAAELLKLVGLEARENFKPKQLSGGQQQRVAIARALMNDPELILCDEPTGQLDSATAVSIMDLMAELNKSGKTIILVTHDKHTASYASKAVHLADGRVQSI
ncbi:MAG TPA: ABC transporter ATP-binding protein [Thermodesulfovibrionia bacterium]|nr:ABC transporter ATP-binding protein [Thermodesulfovibrionia bacterium]